jgi:LPS sulfotransferase NodH
MPLVPRATVTADEAARDHTRPVPFVVLATQRSGSTWVVDMLDSHPQVTAYGELMLSPEKDMMLPRDVEYFNQFLARTSARPRFLVSHYLTLRFLDQVFSSSRADAVGFKLMYDNFFRNPELLGYLVRKRIRIIHVVRENLLDIAISRRAAKSKGVYHVWGDRQVEQVKVELDTAHLVGLLRSLDLQQRLARRWLPKLGLSVCEASYERLAHDRHRYATLLEFLQVDDSRPEALTSNLNKVVRESHADVIVNYLDVRRVLTGTRFEPLLRT